MFFQGVKQFKYYALWCFAALPIVIVLKLLNIIIITGWGNVRNNLLLIGFGLIASVLIFLAVETGKEHDDSDFEG